MKRKTVFFVVICFLLAFGLVSCGEPENKGEPVPAQVTETPQPPEELKDSVPDSENVSTTPDEETQETPAPEEPMESPYIPDDENVSMPDPG